jgi:mRNA-degrading endonuclease RelE of RelBE toxin-antitoxin system
MIFIETPNFSRAILKLLSDDDYRRLQNALLQMPELGNIISGSGGIRKFRWAAKGHGKSGGARVIYYWDATTDTILMLGVYSKSHKKDLTQEEIKELRQVVEREYP